MENLRKKTGIILLAASVLSLIASIFLLDDDKDDTRWTANEPFIANKVSTPENRKRVENFQLEVLKRKNQLLPMFEKYCSDKGYTFRIPIAEVYDFNVLEYSFALWQWGTPVNKIPEPARLYYGCGRHG